MFIKLKAVFTALLLLSVLTLSEARAEMSEETWHSEAEESSSESGAVQEHPEGLCVSAENDSLRLLVDYNSGVFGVENRQNGYIWWSSPQDSESDPVATQVVKDELMSSVLLRYGVPEKRSDNNLLRRSDFDIEIADIPNGIRINYSSDAGFEFPVEYTLGKDFLSAELKVSEIREKNTSNIATEIVLLGSMGAGSSDENGYFVIPDGSGALVRFNNNRTVRSDAYSQMIYGRNITAVPETRGAVTEQICFPMYATVKKDNALLAVAVKGDSDAYISAEVSGQSNSSYNLCNFTFILRNKDSYSMTGSAEKLTVFERGKIKSDDIEVHFYPLSKKDIDYTDIAERYRQYLTEDCGVEKSAEENYNSLYVDLYGGTMKKKSVLGIPVNSEQVLTSYSEAEKILSELTENGADRMTVTYNNWTDDGIRGKVDTAEKPSGKLGGKSKFSEFQEFADRSNILLYPIIGGTEFSSGNGYGYFSDTAVRVSGAYSEITDYDLAFGVPDTLSKNFSLLSPSVFGKVFSDTAENCTKNGINGISAGSFAYSLYGDYGKKSVSRYITENTVKEGLEKLKEVLSDGLLVPCANSYVLPYASHVTNVPSESSRFDIFDEDIPFFQLVLHGLIPYSSEAVNGSPDFERAVLTAVATGSCLHCDMIYSTPDLLQNTRLDGLFYAYFKSRAEKIALYYKLTDEVYKNTSSSTITDYVREGSTITTVYSNGTVVKTDLENLTVDFNGKIISIN